MAVEFNEGPMLPVRPQGGKRRSFVSGLIIKSGIVKTERGAQVVIFALLIIVLGATLFLFRANQTATPEPPTADEVLP